MFHGWQYFYQPRIVRIADAQAFWFFGANGYFQGAFFPADAQDFREADHVAFAHPQEAPGRQHLQEFVERNI